MLVMKMNSRKIPYPLSIISTAFTLLMLHAHFLESHETFPVTVTYFFFEMLIYFG